MTPLSWWWDRSPVPPAQPPLIGEHSADVVIVGGGFTGMWTAYYLTRWAPGLRVLVLEAGRVGFGASGRNGGWCSALFPAEPHRVAAAFGAQAATKMQTAMHATVDEVGQVVEREGIDCDWAKGGSVYLARSEVQVQRAADYVAEMAAYGFGTDDYRELSAAEARVRAGATNVLGGVFTPHCAAIDPLRLLRGVTAAATTAGVQVFENSRVTHIAPGEVRTARGSVRARSVIRATEAYTALLPGARREITPVYSLMIATEPLSDDLWTRIGLADRETFNDLRHLIIYGQRTADGRLAFGGRGAPYHFGSSIRHSYDQASGVHDALARTLVELFPDLADMAITHRWGGPLGIARDWWAGVRYDPTTGLGTAGGYVGDGVGTANLAGRTLAALITGTDTLEIGLPWVNRRQPRWEPEPLRWLGANAGLTAMSLADASEARSNRPSRIAEVVDGLLRGS